MVSQIAEILVAEDNSINQKLILHMLSKLGYTVDLVSNGLQVLDAMKKKQYDLILMDVQMPIMDGIETTATIKQTYTGQYQPVIIAVTAGTTQDETQWCLDAGMDDFIAKPFIGVNIGSKLDYWIKVARQRSGRN